MNADRDQTLDHELPGDLSALAWVQDELRRTLDNAHKLLHRSQREAAHRSANEPDSLQPPSPVMLLQARSLIHQGVGALAMIGQPIPARFLAASEQAVQRLSTHPEAFDATALGDAVNTLERASFALLDFLRRLLAGQPITPLALFPQYRATLMLAGAERVHPADLWAAPSASPRPAAARAEAPLQPGPAVRSGLETALLASMRGDDGSAARRMSELYAGLAAGAPQQPGQLGPLWDLAAGFFDAQAAGLLASDVYSKRAGSRLLAQLRAAEKGLPDAPERLVQDLEFFCAQAASKAAPAQVLAQAPRLASVRERFGLPPVEAFSEVDSPLGRFDPALLPLARRRVAAFKDTWSAVSSGDTALLASASEQAALVADSVRQLYPEGARLASALQAVTASVGAGGEPLRPEVAMEVATGLLCIDASLDQIDLAEPELVRRVHRLAERLDQVAAGGAPEPIEPWMEALYREVSDRQTMGSVVQELRASLAEVEQQLDRYNRHPGERELLIPVPGQLAAMRGVLSVLGLAQASQAVLRMREDVDAMLLPPPDEDEAEQVEVTAERSEAALVRLADNLGGLSFLIDMLGVQPQLAKSLFRFDAASGRFSAVMGRARADEPDEPVTLQHRAKALAEDALRLDVSDERLGQAMEGLVHQAMAADERALAKAVARAHSALSEAEDDAGRQAVRAAVAREMEAFAKGIVLPLAALVAPVSAAVAEPVPPVGAASPAGALAGDDDDMRGIFFEEAREVITQAHEALVQLGESPQDLEALSALRRAFHTLKGSSRMVGLWPFGDTAWACEQLYNARLAESVVQADAPLRDFTAAALAELAAWVDALEAGDSHGLPLPDGQPLVQAANWLREHGALQPVDEPLDREAEEAAASTVPGDLPVLTHLAPDGEPEAEEAAEAQIEAEAEPVEDDAAASELPLPETLVLEDFPEETDDAEVEELTEAEEADFELVLDDPAPVVHGDPSQAIDFDFVLDVGLDEGPLHAADESQEAPASAQEPEPADETTPDLASEAEVEAEPESELEPETEPETAEFEATALQGEPTTFVETTLEQAELPEPTLLEPTEAAAPGVEPEAQPEPDIEPLPTAQVLPFDAAPPDDAERYKLVGSLRIPIALFNIFLNEADEQSRRLCTDLAEWQHELDRPVSESAESLAHSLAGNSATVGYRELSELARRLEHALARSRSRRQGQPAEAQLYADIGDEMRRLLHQFAAGLLRPVPPELLARIATHEAGESSLPAAPGGQITGPAPMQVALGAVRFSPLKTSGPAFGAPLAPSTPRGKPPALRVDDASIGDNLDAADAIDEELFGIFVEEGRELLPALSQQVRQWEAEPADLGAGVAAMRVLHTLKGGARLAGAMRLGEMAHRLETAFEQIAAHGEPDAALLARLHAGVDLLDEEFSRLQAAPSAARAAATEPDLAELARSLPVLPTRPPSTAPTTAPAIAATTQGTPSAPGEGIDWQRFAASAAGRTAPVATLAAAEGVAPGSVRVRGPLLDRMVSHAGEVGVARARIEADVGQMQVAMKELTDNLEKLRRQLRDLELQAETQMSTRLEAARSAAQAFDPLEMDRFTRVQELTRMLAESVDDVGTVQRSLQQTLQSTEDQLALQGRLARDLRDDLLRARMVEFDTLSERLYRVVRQAAKESGKQVRLNLGGGSVELDRNVLDRMAPAFEHLLRNAVVHGIEPPGLREAVGKEASGQIELSLRQVGNEVQIEVRDDGAGLDLARIAERGHATGLLGDDARPTEAELAALIFQPGFSTVDAVTELAGRGIGMDMVRAEVTSLGGRIETASATGRGTAFQMVLPLTTAVSQVVVLVCGALTLAVPSTLVEQVRRLPLPELEAAYRSGVLRHGEHELPFFWLGGLLEQEVRGPAEGRAASVLVVRSASQRVALHVGQVLGNQEVVVRNLGAQLSRLPGLAGISLLAGGETVLIYNPVALAAIYGEQARQRWAEHVAQAERAGPAAEAASVAEAPPVPTVVPVALPPLVLVVDDSLTVRKVTQRLLLREGFRVTLAKDGLEALEMLAAEQPAVMLSDIEMPRMDGFDLVRNVRADTRWQSLPVIMITSRIAEKHREHARALGVEHYLGKPYDEQTLLGLIRACLVATEAAS